jgi:hypothetical protein
MLMSCHSGLFLASSIVKWRYASFRKKFGKKCNPVAGFAPKQQQKHNTPQAKQNLTSCVMRLGVEEEGENRTKKQDRGGWAES